MSLRPIRLYPDPILRRRAAPVERFDADLERLVGDLRETMYDAPGVGLAAPQIGESWRVALVDVDPRGAESKLHAGLQSLSGRSRGARRTPHPRQ